VVRPRDADRTPDELAAFCPDAVAAIADADPFDAGVLERMPGLRIIARMGVGLDSIDLTAAARAGVPVTVTPDVNNETVADHTLALMLAALRRLGEQDAQVRAGGWRDFALCGPQLHAATVGVIGYGAIGRAVTRRLHGFGARVLVHDPFVTGAAAEAAQDAGDELVGFEELLRRSDVVTVHAPLSDATRGLIDATAIAAMKPGAVVVNTARGPIVDEVALAAALVCGDLGAAGLDVFEMEPPVGRPILAASRTVFSPHVGGISTASNLAMSRMATSAVLARLDGRTPEHVVNPEALIPPPARLA
jgi:phosphoglycerate dehydrogenase-like enzyme